MQLRSRCRRRWGGGVWGGVVCSQWLRSRRRRRWWGGVWGRCPPPNGERSGESAVSLFPLSRSFLFLSKVQLNIFLLDATEAQRVNIDSKLAISGAGWPKITCRKGRPLPPLFSETWLSDLSCGIKSGQKFLCFVTIHTFDKTDSFLLTRPPCIQLICWPPPYTRSNTTA